MTQINIILEDAAKDNIKYWWDENYNKKKKDKLLSYFNGFNDFDTFIGDYLTRTINSVERAVEQSEFNRHGRLEFVIGQYDNYTTLAKYFTNKSNDEAGKFWINFHQLMSDFYDKKFWSRKDGCFKTVAHELRHHFDRNFLLYSGDYLRGRTLWNASGKIFESLNSEVFLLKSLFGFRTEGFAEFDGNLFDEKTPSAFLRTRESRADIFVSELQEHTNTVRKVFEFLERNSPCPSMKYLSSIESAKYSAKYSPLGISKEFSPYVQGKPLMNVIALAKVDEMIGKRRSFKSLFKDTKVPEEVYKSVLRKVAGIKSLSEFYNLFYDSASRIGLEKNEIIIPREYTQRYLQHI
mgnify:CR=1 FL=1